MLVSVCTTYTRPLPAPCATGRSVRQVGPPVEVWADALSGTKTFRNDLEVDRGMDFQVC